MKTNKDYRNEADNPDISDERRMVSQISARQRLDMIINYAYLLFCNQVVGGVIKIENEASMQLHLSNILLQLGRLNVFTADEHVDILLEKSITLDRPTSKCPNRKARVDIWIEYNGGNNSSCAAIELKFLKRIKSATITDVRHSVYKDLENLEQYVSQYPGLRVCEIVCSANPNLVQNKGEKFSIGDGTIISSYAGDNTYSRIDLSGKYPVRWDKFGDYSFLKLFPE